MDRGHGGEAEGKGKSGVHAGIDQDLHREALDDLYVVPGGFLRQEGGEARPGAERVGARQPEQVGLALLSLCGRPHRPLGPTP